MWRFNEEFSLSFNPDKSEILLFSDITSIDAIRLTIFGRKIKIVLEEKYLGHVLSSRGSLVNIDSVIKDMKVRNNIIINQFHSTSLKSKIQLFNSQCISFYGSRLWNLSDTKITELCEYVLGDS